MRGTDQKAHEINRVSHNPLAIPSQGENMNGLVETKTILTMDASTLAKRIKNREIRSVDAVITYIHHLKTVNKKIIV